MSRPWQSRASRTGDVYSAGVSVSAIVPLKALRDSKRRLASELSHTERAALMGRLFVGVLRACLAARRVDHVVAVVGDEAGAELARREGVAVVRDPGRGLNAALRHATASLAGHGARRTPDTGGPSMDADASLVVVADLRAARPGDVDALVAAGGTGPGVLVARAHDGGTGALLRRPVDVITPAFGAASAAAHLDAARAAGVRAGLIALPGLAHDIDRPADLARHGDGPTG